MSNVVKISRRSPGEVTVPADVMNRMRLRLYSHPAKEIAEATGLSTSCIYAIRAGRTVWPRPATLFPLLRFTGYRLFIEEI